MPRGKAFQEGLGARKRFTKEQRGAIRAALRLKGDSAEPSYRALGRQFGCSAELLTKVHARMRRQAALPGVNLPDAVSPGQRRLAHALILKEAVERGNLPDEYKTVTKDELLAHLSFYFRQGPDLDRFGQRRWREWLGIARELMVAQDAYRQTKAVEEERDLDELPLNELRKMQQQSLEAAEVIDKAIKGRNARPWERHDAFTEAEVVEEVA